ncbi:hypothetical protein T552_01190 [Pneumocystis carinii B80]|uniref:TIP41-like protein n=1 Tax=Pneumocystis carinii (strain B80) TaxID=1408658 RepID=A0A0W4ZLH7_PNEC8|nr:hypothetical protein T552_01190 [Pneumocystis carinii B80]KTW29234.1 hypothetical protein T552_01190 [Pneumocystis carinii B80]
MIEKEDTIIQHLLPVPHTIVTSGMTRSIHLQDWSVVSRKDSILTSQEIHQFSLRLSIPIPEMTFGKNSVEIKHSSGWKMIFTAYDALEGVDKAGKDVVQVSYAKEWVKNRDKSCDSIEPGKSYDWTFTTTYKGTICYEDGNNMANSEIMLIRAVKNETLAIKAEKDQAKNIDDVDNVVEPVFMPSDEVIPLDKLKRQDPILFFEEVVLYEDELSDNGMSLLSIKVRVMPERLLLLQRFFMRLDNVMFRVRDTRVYIEFSTGKVLREYIEKEASYDEVLQKVSSQQNDFGIFLTDPVWVASVLPTREKTLEALKLG